MAPSFLLDTNVLSEPVRLRPDRGVMDELARHDGELATASVVVHELLFGVARLPRSKKRTRLERYVDEVVLGALPVFGYDVEAARYHASERARLERKGVTPPFVDGQIASIARVHGLTLVTRDESHFTPFEGVDVVSWHE